MPRVRVLIAGTGGVGGYFGARLSEAGHDVRFLSRGENLRALREGGLAVTSSYGDVTLPRVTAVETGEQAGRCDAVWFCVKTYDNDGAAAAIAGAVDAGTVICSLQNGVENEAFLAERFPEAVVLGGITRIEAWLEAPGQVVQKGSVQDLEIGAFRAADGAAAEALAGSFEGTPVAPRISGDIEASLWMKFLGISGVGGITAYGRRAIGPAREDPELRPVLLGVLSEIEALGRARGLDLPPDAAATVATFVDGLDPTLKSSMLRDLERERPLEVESLNGTAVRFGADLGVPTPANERILERLLPLHRAALVARDQRG